MFTSTLIHIFNIGKTDIHKPDSQTNISSVSSQFTLNGSQIVYCEFLVCKDLLLKCFLSTGAEGALQGLIKSQILRSRL